MSLPSNSIKKLMRETIPDGPGLETPGGDAEALFAQIRARLDTLGGLQESTRFAYRSNDLPLLAYDLFEPGEAPSWDRDEIRLQVKPEQGLVLSCAGEHKPSPEIGPLVDFIRAVQARMARRRAQSAKRDKLRNLKEQAIVAQVRNIAKEDGFDFNTSTDTVKLKLYIRLSDRECIEIFVPFNKFQEILPKLRTSISLARELYISGIKFRVKTACGLRWIDHKTL